MSSKKARRELLRALVLAALLSTPYMGVGAEDIPEEPYPIKGNTISGEHNLQGKESLFDFNSDDFDVVDQNVTATDDVSVVSKWKENGTNTKYIFYADLFHSIDTLDLDMKGHSLSIDSDPAIFYVQGWDTQLNIHDADTIEATSHYGNIVYNSGNGNAISLQAQNDIRLTQADQKDSGASITVGSGSELTLDAGHDIVLQNYGIYNTVGVGNGAEARMKAGHDITLDKGSGIHMWSEGSLQMDAGNDITFNEAGIDMWSESTLDMDAVKDITFDKAQAAVQNGAKVQIDAGHDIVFHKTNAESDSSSLYVDNDGEATLHAKNDILFNRDQDGTFIELNYSDQWGKRGPAAATITADGNIIFHEDQASNSSAIYMNSGPTLQIGAQAIKGNTHRLAETTWYANLSLKAKDIEWIAKEPEEESTGLEDDTNMVYSASGSKINFDADNAVTLSTEITPTLIFADYGGDVKMHAGKSIYLHNAGNDAGYTDYYTDDGDDYYNEYYYNYDYKYQSTLWTNTGIIDLTTDGVISVDNKGSAASFAEFDGVINFNGNTIIPKAGIGAKAGDRGKINFNGNTVMQQVDIGAWAETHRDYAEDEQSTITFNGDLVIDQAKTGAVAQYDSDIIFNKGLKIQAEDNAFYAESAGRIKTLTEGVDKVIIGNMRAYNGQIDALFDTADSSFTGFTELREIKKVYSSNEAEEEYPDDGTCPLEPGPGDCGGVEDQDEEILDEGTCPIDPEPGDCGGGEDYGGCEDPVVDEGSHINITLRNGAFWDVTGDSTLTTLDNDSFVNMTDGTRSGTSITAKNLSGTGTIAMDLDWTSNGGAKEKTEHSDYIVATESATGTQTIVSDPATMHLDAMGIDDRLYFATLTNSDAVFTSPITQQNVTKGSLYDYTIGITSETTTTTDAADTMADRAAADTTTDWFFGTIGYTESPAVETGRINSNIMYDLVTDVDTLNKRMGDVRNMNTDPDGWWARTTYTHQDRDSYSGHSNRFELGKDFVISRDDGSVVHQGAVFTYLRSSDSFDNGNGKYKRYSGALYHTWLGNSGRYVDVVGRMGKVMGNSHTFLINGTQSDSSFGTWYQQASVETGKTYDLDDGWYFEPQAQLQYTHMNSKSYTSSDGINHDLDSVNSFIGRLGFRLGQRINDKTSWYVKGDILHEFSGDGGIMLTSANGLERIDYNRDGKDTWYDLGAGLTAELSPASSLWFEFERKFSGSYSNNWEFNGGISWKF